MMLRTYHTTRTGKPGAKTFNNPMECARAIWGWLGSPATVSIHLMIFSGSGVLELERGWEVSGYEQELRASAVVQLNLV